jgi:hypothetical protein
MTFWDRLTRVFRGSKRRRVELKPLEQVALGLLIKTGGTGAAEIQREIESTAGVWPRPAAEVLQPLLEQGLVEARLRPELDASEAFFVPTADGLKLRGHLPAEPTTITDFWI